MPQIDCFACSCGVAPFVVRASTHYRATRLCLNDSKYILSDQKTSSDVPSIGTREAGSTISSGITALAATLPFETLCVEPAGDLC